MGKNAWLALLDLRKAFLWLKRFWLKLIRYGLASEIISYWKNLCKYLRKGAHRRNFSDNFEIPLGLMEGCVSLPLLFLIFIMDLAEELEKRDLGVKKLKDTGWQLAFLQTSF